MVVDDACMTHPQHLHSRGQCGEGRQKRLPPPAPAFCAMSSDSMSEHGSGAAATRRRRSRSYRARHDARANFLQLSQAVLRLQTEVADRVTRSELQTLDTKFEHDGSNFECFSKRMRKVDGLFYSKAHVFSGK